jgi:glutathione S-transferase
MIELYYWPTPNGHKITMFLEEAGLEYRIHPVDISAGDQFKPEFLALSPNNRMPAIIDTAPADGGESISLFESGAILFYLAEKTGLFLPKDIRGRKAVTEWLFWQIGGLGPMAGQNHHFGGYAPEKIPYAIARYVNETNRLYAGCEPAASSPARTTRSPTWPRILGSSHGSASSKTSTTSRTCDGGLTPSGSDLGRFAPIPKASPMPLGLPSPKRARRFCSDRPRRTP